MVFTIQYSTLSLTGSQFIFLKWDGSIWDLGGKFWQKQMHLFWTFWSLSFNFFFKRGNHEKHPYSKCDWISAIHNSLLYTGVRYLLWRYRNFSLAFTYFRNFEAITSPLNLELSWQPSYSTVSCCLMEWPAKWPVL